MRILARGLELAYRGGPTVVVADRLELPDGELVSLVGPNGGGKTTLLRSLAGLLPPRAGTVTIGDRPVYGRRGLSRRDRARLLSVVLTDSVAPAYLRVRELVAMGRLPYQRLVGRESSDDRRAVDRALAQTGTAHLAGRPAGRLSDGERQRVMIARALAQEPEMLLLDEPAAHLDPPHQTALFQLLDTLVRDGIVSTAVIATHHLHLALHFSPRLVLVAGGSVHPGAAADLLESGALEEAFLRDLPPATAAESRLDPRRGWFVPSG
mgnify:CR=1 FL=1